MSIYYDNSNRVFHLQSSNSSYMIQIAKGEIPVHLYWGPKLGGKSFPHSLDLVERSSFSPSFLLEDKPIH